MDRKTHRTKDAQDFWDKACLDVLSKCIDQLELKGAAGCAQLAREAADAALKERNDSRAQS